MRFNKKLIGLFAGVCISVSAALVVTSTMNKRGFFTTADETYKIVLNQSNRPTELTSSFQNYFTGTIKTHTGYDVNLAFVNARSADDCFAQLAPRGKIYNFASSNNKVTGINSVKFTGQGTLLFKPVIDKTDKGGYLAEVAPISFAAGDEAVAVPSCDYFEITAADGGAQIDSLELKYSCDANATDIKMLNGTYTGVGSDSSTYKMCVTDGVGSIQSLDKQTNITLNGTAQMLSKTSVKFTFVYNAHNIYYNMNYDGHTLTFVSKNDDVGGAAANQVAQVSLNRVYTLEDFESYSATGQGYTSSTTKYQTSGLRANYYADYYTGSSSSEIGGSGWQIMTSTDNSNYTATKGHNGSKGGIFKFSNGSKMRYISMNELYGVKSMFKGTKLSFWARGAYTNTNFNVDHSSNTPMKFYAFYTTPLTSGTQSNRAEAEFTVQAGDTWQRFELDLDSTKTYYGFGFYAYQSSGSAQYLPIDDIEVYTASPYAEYVAPVAATGVTVTPDNLDLTTGQTSQLTATVAPSDATNKAVAWSSNNTSVATVDATGKVTAVAAGNATITATTDDGGFTDTCAVTVSALVMDYPEGTYRGIATVNGDDFSLVIAIGNATNGLVAVRLSNLDAEATGITYNSSNKKITITTTGSYQGLATYGNITGYFDDTSHVINQVQCDGTISSYVSNNGSITCNAATTGLWNCDGTTAELQATFKRRYMSGSWQVDNSNADRVASNTAEYVSGTGSVKRRGYGSNAVAMNFQNDFSPTMSVENIQYWVYNPSGSDITIRMWYYASAGLTGGAEIGSVTAKAGQWTYVAMGFGTHTIYNFQIADFTNSGAYLSFDNIYLF